jgi:hypothetical protein
MAASRAGNSALNGPRVSFPRPYSPLASAVRWIVRWFLFSSRLFHDLREPRGAEVGRRRQWRTFWVCFVQNRTHMALLSVWLNAKHRLLFGRFRSRRNRSCWTAASTEWAIPSVRLTGVSRPHSPTVRNPQRHSRIQGNRPHRWRAAESQSLRDREL